jgi:hypothetical protein
MKILDFLRGLKIKRFQRKMEKYKPDILDIWRDELEEEYKGKFEYYDNEIFRLNKVVAEEHRNMEYWHGKYDAQKEVYDGIKNNMVQKIESTAMKAGEQKEQIKNLKNDLKEKEES